MTTTTRTTRDAQDAGTDTHAEDEPARPHDTSVESGSVVVGYDGSPGSLEALTWAAVEAREAGAPLTVLHAHDFLGTTGVLMADVSLVPGLERAAAEAARRVAEEGAQIARDLTTAPVHALWRVINPAEALVLASREASLVVVGNRGRGTWRAALLGSVAFTVSAHAASPVLVLRPGMARSPDGDHPVVVSVDGSPSSGRALEVAADLAARSAAPLRVLTAWMSPVTWTYGAALAATADSFGPYLDDYARATNDAAAAAARHRHPGLVVDADVVHGAPDLMLRDASRGAGRVVVGSQGHGRVLSAVLGSVSQAAIHSCRCPVEVVRPTAAAAGEGDNHPEDC